MGKVTALRNHAAPQIAPVSVEAATAEVEAAEKERSAASIAAQGRRVSAGAFLHGDRSPEQEALIGAENRLRLAKDGLERAQLAAEHSRSDADRRKALAEAIDNAKAAEGTMKAWRAAVSRAADNLATAEAGLTAATAAVADAKSQHASGVEQAAKSGSTATAGAALRTARARQTDSQDDVEAGRAAHAKLASQLVELEEASSGAASAIETAADSVLSAAVDAMVAEAGHLMGQLEERRHVLHYLRRLNIDRASADLVSSFLGRIPSGADEDHAATDPWRAARAALLQDAGAPLPGAV